MNEGFEKPLLIVNVDEAFLQELCSAGYIASDVFDGRPCKDATLAGFEIG